MQAHLMTSFEAGPESEEWSNENGKNAPVADTDLGAAMHRFPAIEQNCQLSLVSTQRSGRPVVDDV